MLPLIFHAAFNVKVYHKVGTASGYSYNGISHKTKTFLTFLLSIHLSSLSLPLFCAFSLADRAAFFFCSSCWACSSANFLRYSSPPAPSSSSPGQPPPASPGSVTSSHAVPAPPPSCPPHWGTPPTQSQSQPLTHIDQSKDINRMKTIDVIPRSPIAWVYFNKDTYNHR